MGDCRTWGDPAPTTPTLDGAGGVTRELPRNRRRRGGGCRRERYGPCQEIPSDVCSGRHSSQETTHQPDTLTPSPQTHQTTTAFIVVTFITRVFSRVNVTVSIYILNILRNTLIYKLFNHCCRKLLWLVGKRKANIRKRRV